MRSFGFETSIQVKHSESTIKSAFVKGNTSQHLLSIAAPEDIVRQFGQGRLVKIEVDTQPPLDFERETKTLLVPTPFTIQNAAKTNGKTPDAAHCAHDPRSRRMRMQGLLRRYNVIPPRDHNPMVYAFNSSYSIV